MRARVRPGGGAHPAKRTLGPRVHAGCSVAGRRFRMLTVLDVFARECLAPEAATSFRATADNARTAER